MSIEDYGGEIHHLSAMLIWLGSIIILAENPYERAYLSLRQSPSNRMAMKKLHRKNLVYRASMILPNIFP